MKKIIIAIIIVIICIGILLSLILLNNNNLGKNEDIEQDFNNDYDGMQDISNRNEYYDVSECVKRYFNSIRDSNIEYLMKILDKDYIEKMNITEKNIYKYTYEGNGKKIHYLIKDIKVKYNTKVTQYVINCKVSVEGIENSMYLIVLVDNTTMSFSVLPINEKYDDITNIKLKDNLKTIEKNTRNIYIYNSISDETMCKFLLQNYIINALYFPKDLYNSLDENYRNTRFSDYKDFKKFIGYNKNKLRDSIVDDLMQLSDFKNKEEYLEYIKGLDKISLYKYIVETNENVKDYVCLDQNGCYYIFREKNFMEYTLKLDTYTITSEKFKKEYTEGNDTKKCQLNIDKFFKMINNKDYTHAYEVLDEGFKNNYFKSQEDFEKFVTSRFYEFNNIKFNSASYEGNIYIFKLTVTDVKNSNSSFDMNVFMKLKDNMDFVMSFGKS